MLLKARPILAAGALALAVSLSYAQQPDPQGGNPGGGRGMRGGGQGQGPLIDPGQFPGGPGGRGRLGGPARDNQAAPKGTAKLSGRVMSAETGNPLRRAQVRLTAPEIRVNRVATSDNNGRYEFAGLAAGRYRLQI